MYFLLNWCCNSLTSHADSVAAAAARTAANALQGKPVEASTPADAVPVEGVHNKRSPAQEAVAETGSSADKLQAILQNKSCGSRACTTAQDMFAAFQSAQFQQRRGSKTQPGFPASSTTTSGTTAAAAAAVPAERVLNTKDNVELQDTAVQETASSIRQQQGTQPQHSVGAGQASNSHQQEAQQQQQRRQPFWFFEDEMPCPADILELGRSTWTLLHSIAAYYPDNPTPQQQQQMHQFIAALGEFYPCQECAGHLRRELKELPPAVGSAAELSDWMCRLHNMVNVRLGKPEFDCSVVFQRWRDGPADDPDACGVGH
eukprot:GHRR01014880.1.p1 GENE.GHRR01014880.1~~GHRR01014880.1.p1  ORF type:complete len:316 (+),score=108.38 GHRR01014880.1:504-1451(+)